MGGLVQGKLSCSGELPTTQGTLFGMAGQVLPHLAPRLADDTAALRGTLVPFVGLFVSPQATEKLVGSSAAFVGTFEGFGVLAVAGFVLSQSGVLLEGSFTARLATLIWQRVAVSLLVFPEALEHGVGPVAARVGAPKLWLLPCV